MMTPRLAIVLLLTTSLAITVTPTASAACSDPALDVAPSSGSSQPIEGDYQDGGGWFAVAPTGDGVRTEFQLTCDVAARVIRCVEHVIGQTPVKVWTPELPRTMLILQSPVYDEFRDAYDEARGDHGTGDPEVPRPQLDTCFR